MRAGRLMHGKTSLIHHDGQRIYRGVENPFVATRYHSLIVQEPLPPGLETTARTPEGEIMGIRHRDYPLEGVQFHPESILSKGCAPLFATWVTRCAATACDAGAARAG